MLNATKQAMTRRTRRRHLATSVAALSLATLLGGCITYSSPVDATLGAMSYLENAAVDQDFQTVVVGNPYPQSVERVNGMVNAAFQKNYEYLRTKFTTAPANSPLNPYKMVVLFDPPRQAQYDEFCTAPDKVGSDPGKGSMRILALFCERAVITEMQARISPRPGINSAELREALDFLAWQLVPQDEPISEDCNLPNC